MGTENGSAILGWLLARQERVDTADLATFAQWKERFDAEAPSWDMPVDRAIVGGFLADRVSYAFAGGYESALRRLVPSLPERAVVSFCVTEEKGGHPSSVRSSLKKAEGGSWTLNGGKKFVTLAMEAEILLVAASTGTAPDGRNMIRMAAIGRDLPGVAISVMAGLPFVPEISHGTVAFTDVPVRDGDLLPGDGYTGYIRPFRTIEDLHVDCAVLGYLLRCACLFRWPAAVKERTAAAITCARALALDDPASPAVHIAIGGLHAQMASLIEGLTACWGSADEKTRAGWQRDSALLRVAEKARARRLETAWTKV